MNILLKVLGVVLFMILLTGCANKILENPSLIAARMSDSMQQKLPYTQVIKIGKHNVELISKEVYSSGNTVYFVGTTNYHKSIQEELKVPSLMKESHRPMCNNWQMRKALKHGLVIVYKLEKDNEVPITFEYSEKQCQVYNL